MTAFPPIPGSPDVVEQLAAALHDEAVRVASAQERLLVLRQQARWDSPAGRAFAAHLAQLPRVLDAVAQRYAAAAAALRTFAAAFRQAQDECNLAVSLRERGVWRRDRYAEALARAEASESPHELARAPELHRLMVEGAREVLENEDRWRAARARFDEADRRCSQALGAMLRDTLTDSVQYDTLKGGAHLADSVSSAATCAAWVPVWRPVATAVGVTAESTGLLLDAAVKLAYDEGEWGAMGEALALGVAGFGAGALRTGALAKDLPGATGGGARWRDAARRLAHGVTSQAKANDPWTLRPAATKAAATRSSTASGASRGGRPLSVHDRVRALARERALKPALARRSDWRAAERNGADARTLLLTAWGLEAGTSVYTRTKQVNAAYERAEGVRERWRAKHAADR